MTDVERWEPIRRSERGDYAVSENGGVMRLTRGRKGGTRPGRMSKWSFTVDGYPQVSILVRGKHGFQAVHRLVANAFLGPCPTGLWVNHKDGNKLNAHVSNLEYVTPGENRRHAHRIGLMVGPRGATHGMAKLNADGVRRIRALYADGVSQYAIADLCGTDQTNVSLIVRRRTWKHVD